MKIKKQKKVIREFMIAILCEMSFIEKIKFCFKKNYFMKPLQKVVEKLRVNQDANLFLNKASKSIG